MKPEQTRVSGCLIQGRYWARDTFGGLILAGMAAPSVTLNSTPLAVLAGGEGSRMGGPKGLLRIGGQPILDFVLDQLKWPGPTWLITAPGREHPPGWERFDRELRDPTARLGPLRGVLTALDELRAPRLVVMTVDMPAIGDAQLKWLLWQLDRRPECLGVMCRRRDAGVEKVEPFPIALRSEARPVIETRLEAHRRSVIGLLEEPGFMAIPAPTEWDAAVWTNLNDPGDLARFVKRGEDSGTAPS